MIVQKSSRFAALVAGSFAFAFAGSALAGSGPPAVPECGWGVARDISGNNKFFIDEDKDGASNVSFVFGPAVADILVGDWDGNGIDNVAIRKDVSGNGKFFFNNDTDSGDEGAFVLGEIAAVPLSGDWNGDGTDNVGVRRTVSGTGKFFLDTNGGGSPEIDFVFGSPSDTAVVGDWDGDDEDEIGIVRDVNGGYRWFFSNNTNTVTNDFAFGKTGDIAIVGDWDDDGDDNPGLVRATAGALKYFLDTNNDGTAEITFTFGTAATDTPLVCDFSGAGDEIGVAREDASATALRFLTTPELNGVLGLRVRFGDDGDTPIVGTFEGLSGL
jgi:hypothetical protein